MRFPAPQSGEPDKDRSNTSKSESTMAKYVFYLFLIFAFIFALEFFNIVDVPYLEIPDYVSGTEEQMQRGLKEAEKVE